MKKKYMKPTQTQVQLGVSTSEKIAIAIMMAGALALAAGIIGGLLLRDIESARTTVEQQAEPVVHELEDRPVLADLLYAPSQLIVKTKAGVTVDEVVATIESMSTEVYVHSESGMGLSPDRAHSDRIFLNDYFNFELKTVSPNVTSTEKVFTDTKETQDVTKGGLGEEVTELDRVYVLYFSNGGIDPYTLSQGLSDDPDIEFVEPNYLYRPTFVPDDPRYAEQWAHQNTHAEDGWDVTTGSPDVQIAIIDSGVDYSHEDLTNVMWDDGSGNPGYDFTDIDTALYEAAGYALIPAEDYTVDDVDPSDYYGHGTHCAGIAAGDGNNSVGITGVCPDCQIMAVRAAFGIIHPEYGEIGLLESDDVADALYYAADNGAEIINMSFGSSSSSATIAEGVAYAHNAGAVLIGAAGNNGSSGPHFPSTLADVISVASSAQDDFHASYSNHGQFVEIAAPGGDFMKDAGILSTIPTTGTLGDPTGYRALQGTSMAAPYAAGLVGLLFTQYPSYSPDDVRWVLQHSTDVFSSQESKYIGTGRVNNANALAQDTIPNVTATITYPVWGTVIENPAEEAITITGSALGTSFKLYYGEGFYPDDWQLLAEGGTGSGDLGTWDITELYDGDYMLKLVVFDGTIATNKFSYVTIDQVPGGWPLELPSDAPCMQWQSSPSIADVDGDGELDLIATAAPWAGYDPGFVYAIRPDGTIKWETYISASLRNSPTLADTDGDNKMEILIFDLHGVLYCLDSAGKILWEFDGGEITYRENMPVVADLEGDGVMEIIYPVFKNDGPEAHEPGIIHVLHNINNQPVIVYQHEVNVAVAGQITHPMTVYDVDDDGIKEILVKINGEKIVNFDIEGGQIVQKWLGAIGYYTNAIGNLDNEPPIDIISDYYWSPKFIGSMDVSDGSEQWSLMLSDFDPQAIANTHVIKNVVLSDCNGDSQIDILVTGNPHWPNDGDVYNKLYCFGDFSGPSHEPTTLYWVAELNDYNIFNHMVTASADLDGDGITENITAERDMLYVFDHTGALRWSVPGAYSYYISFADMDRNGTVEVLTAAGLFLQVFDKDGKNYVFKGYGDKPINPIPWTQFQHDIQRTGHYRTCGDVNDSGNFNMADVTSITAFMGGFLEPVTPLEAYDINRDGSVDGDDVRRLVDYLYNGVPSPCTIICSDKTETGSCNTDQRYCDNGTLLQKQYCRCGVGCPSGYDCEGGQCCRKVGGTLECIDPLIQAQEEAPAVE